MDFQNNLSIISKAIASISKFDFTDIKINVDDISIGTKVALSAVTLFGLLSLKYNDRAIFTKRRTDIPFIKGAPLVGTLFRQIATAERIYDDITETFKKLDTLTMAQSIIGLPPQIMTIDPLNIEYVLKHNTPNYVKGPQMLDAMGDLFGKAIFTTNGEAWKYQRKTASHIFNVVTLRDHFTDIFVQELRSITKHIFDMKAVTGEPIDFAHLMSKYTMECFVRVAFGKRLNGVLNEMNAQFAISFDTCQHISFNRFVNPFTDMIEWMKPIFSPGTTSYKQHMQIINNFAYGIIKERRLRLAAGYEFQDMLSRFMTTEKPNGELLNDNELRDTLLTFLAAGRDTTADAINWTFYCLMMHPRVEEKLMQEIEKHLPNDMDDPQELYEVIKRMTYAHAVFYEVLRLYPSVPTNIRLSLEEDHLPSGAHIRKGDSVMWSPYAAGRSTKIWGENAGEFVPERWVTDEGDLQRVNQCVWPAFNAGPRVCLGQNLATLEALIVITFLLKQFKFTLVPGQEITYALSLTLQMRYGMKVHVTRR